MFQQSMDEIWNIAQGFSLQHQEPAWPKPAVFFNVYRDAS